MTAQARATAPAVNSQGSCVRQRQASAGLALVTSNGGNGSRRRQKLGGSGLRWELREMVAAWLREGEI